MAENITRCPKCNTSFRISQKHLDTGKGAVRCGSCLHVFIARDYLINSMPDDEISPDTAEAAATQIETPIETPAETNQIEPSIEDDFLISDEMDIPQHDSTEDDDSPADHESDVEQEYNEALFGADQKPDYEFNLFEREQPSAESEEPIPQDESWALDLLNGDEEEPQEEAPTKEELKEQEEKDITQEFDTSYYKNSFQIVGEESNEEATHNADAHDGIASETSFTESDETLEIEEFDYSEGPQALYETPTSKGRYLDSIEPEPVEFNWQQRSNLWHSKLLWGGLSLFAGLLLITQIAWLKFDTLSVVEPYRSYYSSLCPMVGCKLPPLIDRNKIKTANLVVRSHPKLRGALIVDVVLQNNASFAQKFPVLDLVFTNSQDKVVAAKRLLPENYLRGELTGRKNMPVRQPIHIAIEIADPGSHATGYKMTIAQ